VPDSKKEMIGVRLPEIRKIVNSVSDVGDANIFLNSPHVYYEEFMAHGLLIAKFCEKLDVYRLLNEFLPYIDNWAVCDTTVLSLKKLSKNKDLLLQNVINWLKSENIYTVRFAIVSLLAYFSEKQYSEKIFELVLAIKSNEYYVNMAIAWLLSVMLINDYDKTVKLLESKTLPRFIQNKTIDKARESYRIENNKKIYLKTLKV
jgi:3-methyladenine DNA glycosylase AlkD